MLDGFYRLWLVLFRVFEMQLVWVVLYFVVFRCELWYHNDGLYCIMYAPVYEGHFRHKTLLKSFEHFEQGSLRS